MITLHCTYVFLLLVCCINLTVAVNGADKCHQNFGYLTCDQASLQEAIEFAKEYETKGNRDYYLYLTNLNGTLDKYEDLHFLNTLSITNSKINSIRKLEFSDKMPHLSHLTLSAVDLKYVEPDAFLRISELKRLNLSMNQLKQCDLNLSNVEELELSQNQIGLGSTAKLIGPKVIYVNLSTNALKTIKKTTFERLERLEELDLSDNQIEIIPQNTFTGNLYLEKLWLQKNLLSSFLVKSPSLLHLNLSYNQFAHLDLDTFAGVPKVTNLYLRSNDITFITRPFDSLTHLLHLDLSYNNLVSLGSDWFQKNRQLETLRLSHNQIFELNPFSNQVSLNLLDLSHNKIGKIDQGFFSQMPKLATLDLSHNNLVKVDGAFKSLININRLLLSDNFLAISKDTFRGLDELNYLDLSNNKLKNLPIENLNSLKSVNVNHNYLTSICELRNTKIQTLCIEHNNVKTLETDCLPTLKELGVMANPVLISAEDKSDLVGGVDLIFCEDAWHTDTVDHTHSGNTNDNGKWEPIDKDTTISEPMETQPAPKSTYNSNKLEINADDEIDGDFDDDSNNEDVDGNESDSDQDADEDDDDDDDDKEENEENEGDNDEEEIENDDQQLFEGITQSEKKSFKDILRLSISPSGINEWIIWLLILSGICMILIGLNVTLYTVLKRKGYFARRAQTYSRLKNEVYKDTTITIDGNRKQKMLNMERVFASNRLKSHKLKEILSNFQFKDNHNDSQVRSQESSQMIPQNPQV